MYKWAKRRKCPPAMYVYSNDVEHSSYVELSRAQTVNYGEHTALFKFNWRNTIIDHAALRGYAELAKYVYKHTKVWPHTATLSAIIGNNLDIMRFAHKKFIADCDMCETAVYHGNLEIVKLFSEGNNVSYKFKLATYDCICEYAAKHNKFEIFKWALANYTFRNSMYFHMRPICKYIVENGNLDMLIYACVNGCAWSRCSPNSRPNLKTASPEIKDWCHAHGLQ